MLLSLRRGGLPLFLEAISGNVFIVNGLVRVKMLRLGADFDKWGGCYLVEEPLLSAIMETFPIEYTTNLAKCQGSILPWSILPAIPHALRMRPAARGPSHFRPARQVQNQKTSATSAPLRLVLKEDSRHTTCCLSWLYRQSGNDPRDDLNGTCTLWWVSSTPTRDLLSAERSCWA